MALKKGQKVVGKIKVDHSKYIYFTNGKGETIQTPRKTKSSK